MIYEYQCKDCGSKFEISLPLGVNLVTPVICNACRSLNVKKLFNSIGVIFKGNGFYQNDKKSDKVV
jgi:putative FmdB family regulatory protein